MHDSNLKVLFSVGNPCISISIPLIQLLGVYKAIILQQVYYLSNFGTKNEMTYDDYSYCRINRAFFEKQFGLNKRTVLKHIRELTRAGLLVEIETEDQFKRSLFRVDIEKLSNTFAMKTDNLSQNLVGKKPSKKGKKSGCINTPAGCIYAPTKVHLCTTIKNNTKDKPKKRKTIQKENKGRKDIKTILNKKYQLQFKNKSDWGVYWNELVADNCELSHILPRVSNVHISMLYKMRLKVEEQGLDYKEFLKFIVSDWGGLLQALGFKVTSHIPQIKRLYGNIDGAITYYSKYATIEEDDWLVENTPIKKTQRKKKVKTSKTNKQEILNLINEGGKK